MEFEYFDPEQQLMNLNELKNAKQQRKQRRNRTKERAESQFDVTAKPIKLEVFFKDMLACAPDIPDLTVELDGKEEFAPMIIEPNIYPVNSAELSAEVLDTANDILELEKPEEFNLQTNSVDAINIISDQMKRLKSIQLMTGIDSEDVEIRSSTPNLTAKRFSIKALQLFSFSDHYSKHFTFDKAKLRELNTDMIIDESDESRRWLNLLGEKYQTIYHKHQYPSGDLMDDRSVLERLDPANKFFRALGYSTILKILDLKALENVHQPLSMTMPFIKDTAFYNISVFAILDYFGIKIFGIDPLLNFQLNYLHLIPYYIKTTKKQKIFKIFEYLDLKNNLFNK